MENHLEKLLKGMNFARAARMNETSFEMVANSNRLTSCSLRDCSSYDFDFRSGITIRRMWEHDTIIRFSRETIKRHLAERSSNDGDVCQCGFRDYWLRHVDYVSTHNDESKDGY